MILVFLSALCAFASVSLLALWLQRRAATAYAAGLRELRASRINPHVEVAQGSFVGYANRLGFLFVPLVNRLITSGQFGVNELLAGWQRQLLRAGWGTTLTPVQMLSGSLAASAAAGVFLGLVFLLWGAGLPGAALVGFPAGAAAGFCFLPLLVRRLAADRVALIEKRLPFAIEFQLLAMEASAAFPGALQVYCEQMRDDPLAEEYRAVLRNVDDGLGLEASLAQMAARLGSDALASFVLAVTTGIETGQPLKAVLKVQADAARQRRYKAAEEFAKAAGARAVFPLFLVMIAVVLLLVAPLLMKLMSGGLL